MPWLEYSARGLGAAATLKGTIVTVVIDLLERARKQHESADRARRLIALSTDHEVIARLTTYADELDAGASALELRAVALSEAINRTTTLSQEFSALEREAIEHLETAKAKLPPKR
jgi:hypothetical protein